MKPPPPFEDIKPFTLQAAAEPRDKMHVDATDDGDDELDRMRDVLSEDEMNQWIAEKLIRRYIGPKAFETTCNNDFLTLDSSVGGG